MGSDCALIGGLDLVAAGEANAFIEACEGAGVRILGIEGFRIGSSNTIHVVMDAIADFSDVADPATSAR